MELTFLYSIKEAFSKYQMNTEVYKKQDWNVQWSFVVSRRCTDQILVLQQVTEKYKSVRKKESFPGVYYFRRSTGWTGIGLTYGIFFANMDLKVGCQVWKKWCQDGSRAGVRINGCFVSGSAESRASHNLVWCPADCLLRFWINMWG